MVEAPDGGQVTIRLDRVRFTLLSDPKDLYSEASLRVQQTNINDKFIEVIGKYEGNMCISEMISYVSLLSLTLYARRVKADTRNVRIETDKIWEMNSVRNFSFFSPSSPLPMA